MESIVKEIIYKQLQKKAEAPIIDENVYAIMMNKIASAIDSDDSEVIADLTSEIVKLAEEFSILVDDFVTEQSHLIMSLNFDSDATGIMAINGFIKEARPNQAKSYIVQVKLLRIIIEKSRVLFIEDDYPMHIARYSNILSLLNQAETTLNVLVKTIMKSNSLIFRIVMTNTNTKENLKDATDYLQKYVEKLASDIGLDDTNAEALIPVINAKIRKDLEISSESSVFVQYGIYGITVFVNAEANDKLIKWYANRVLSTIFAE